MMGKPVIAGTRITVELILEKLAAGETMEQLLEAHPRLTREAVQAALAFAADALRADVIYPTRLLYFSEYQVNHHLAMAVCCLANKVAKISTACCPRWSCSWA